MTSPHPDCEHRAIRAWTLGSARPYLWSCVDCGRQFVPAGEHAHDALARRLAFGDAPRPAVETDSEGGTPD